MRVALPLSLLLALTLGCQSKKSDAIVAAPTTPTPGAQAQSPGLSGTVLERLEASPYSYLRIKTAQGEVWAAVPETKVEKGATVTVANPMPMNNFESKTLKRTFAEVFFGTLATPGAAPTTATATPSPAGGTGTPAPSPVLIAKVDKASGSDAKTVAEIWSQKASLKEKHITIRGQVVKYNPMVMGKNWIHLQDGSGDPAKATHDITVTTMDNVAKGDVVTVKGVVRVDKDFGSGYTYAIIVEDAKVVKK